MFDPGERDALGEEYRRNRERLISERDGKVENARRSNEP
jgi:hypothetical protein